MDTGSRGNIHVSGNDTMNRLIYLPIVEERPLHFLRQWRKFRHMTQQELADSVGTSKTVISEMERGNLQLSPKWLRKFAPVLRTQPGYILDHDPDDLATDIIDIWSHIPEGDRDTASGFWRASGAPAPTAEIIGFVTAIA
jgi:transcriptional regulator with XRE-family HTH domain